MPDRISKHPTFRGERFPMIRTIADVEASIVADKGIRALPHDDITIVRYLINSSDVFTTILDAECRGLIFDAETGELLSRPLHKFFNLFERELPEEVDFSTPGDALEKLDGSMMGAFENERGLFFHTRGGRSRQSRHVDEFASPAHRAAAKDAIDAGYSPSFEHIGPGNRIVIDYDEEDLRLITLRHRLTGVYNDALARDLAHAHGINMPRVIASQLSSTSDLLDFIAESKDRTDLEGGILAFPDGYRLKMKFMPYIHKHKILSFIHIQKNALRAVLDDVLDDVVPSLFSDQAEFLNAYASDLLQVLMDAARDIETAVGEVSHLERRYAVEALNKRFAKEVAPIAIACLKGRPAFESITAKLSKECKTNDRAAAIVKEWSLRPYEPPAGLFPAD